VIRAGIIGTGGVIMSEESINIASRVTPIENLLGAGVTIIGSDEPMNRYILQEQMAISIATGEKFLGMFDTHQSKVLYVVHGKADFKALTERPPGAPSLPQNLRVHEGWERIDQGGMQHLKEWMLFNAKTGIIFLGDFGMIQSNLGIWINNKLAEQADLFRNADRTTLQDFKRDLVVENVRKLRDFSSEYGVSIVLGGDLNLKGKLHDRGGLRHRDNEIRIYRSGEIAKLEVVSPGRYVQPRSWRVMIDYDARTIQLHEREIRQIERNNSLEKRELSLTDREKAIIDAMWEKDPMRAREIEKASGVVHSTLAQKLKALQEKRKGEWIIELPSGEYIADSSKHRYWRE
jgi:hypothetical protein